MIVIGLTGGIATGKSTVSGMLLDMELPLIDSDIVSRDIASKNSPIIKEIEAAFGSIIINSDGSLNREKLGSIIFKDSSSKEKLNSIIHPAIKDELINRIQGFKNMGEKICIVDGALLGESIFVDFYDKLILVYVDINIQIARLMKRNSLSYEEAINRISSQVSFDEKKKIADYIIDNSYDIEYTKKQVENIINEIKALEEFDV